MHRVLRSVVLLVIGGALLGASIPAQSILEGEFGASKRSTPKTASPESPPATPPASIKDSEIKSAPSTGKRYPYHGTLDLADPEGRSITLAGKKKPRVILITSSTNITRDGRRVSLKEVIKGEKVSGSVIKNEEGQEQALTLRLRGIQ